MVPRQSWLTWRPTLPSLSCSCRTVVTPFRGVAGADGTQASPGIGADVWSDQMSGSQTNLAWDTLLELGAPGSGPLHARLSRALRRAIRSGRLPAGSALPPSRQLAADLGCSRWVVTEAYAQLAAEGWLQARVGSGTRVRPLGAAAGGRPAPDAPP